MTYPSPADGRLMQFIPSPRKATSDLTGPPVEDAIAHLRAHGYTVHGGNCVEIHPLDWSPAGAATS